MCRIQPLFGGRQGRLMGYVDRDLEPDSFDPLLQIGQPFVERSLGSGSIKPGSGNAARRMQNGGSSIASRRRRRPRGLLRESVLTSASRSRLSASSNDSVLSNCQCPPERLFEEFDYGCCRILGTRRA